jgi:hypothetical protein
MITDLKSIASLVSQQFPAFYQEDGPNFVQFVKAYYEWMDEQGPILKSRNLFEDGDIDTVGNDYINYFMTKFMRGIPQNIAADKRFLEKHILDIYRSKGSVEGLKLLFRLLYNEEINVYIPQVDMLTLSDGKWVRKQYLEVEERPFNYTYGKKIITGSSSGAKAFVTSASVLYTGSRVAQVLYISDIQDGPTGSSFVIGEYLVYDGLDIKDATLIKGSATGAAVIYSSENHAPGDILFTQNTNGEGLQFTVSSILDADKARGYIDFKLLDGGYGFTLNSPITISYKGASRGSGAGFKIKSLANTEVFHYNINPVSQVLDTLLSASDYGANLRNSSINSLLDNALTSANVTIGSISALTAITSGDHNYNGSVQPTIFEPRVFGYGIQDKNGNYWGNNAVITGNLATGNGVINGVELLSSGYDYNIPYQTYEFINASNNEATAQLTITTSAIGLDQGDWVDSTGFLNSDKYIQDSDYYQYYSYEIQFEKSLDKYVNILKQVMHPVGNKVFGKPVIVDTIGLNEQILVDTLVVK